MIDNAYNSQVPMAQTQGFTWQIWTPEMTDGQVLQFLGQWLVLTALVYLLVLFGLALHHVSDRALLMHRAPALGAIGPRTAVARTAQRVATQRSTRVFDQCDEDDLFIWGDVLR